VTAGKRMRYKRYKRPKLLLVTKVTRDDAGY
jgi:hypothetical protein